MEDIYLCDDISGTLTSDPSAEKLATVIEFAVVQELIKNIKAVLLFPKEILERQERYWLRLQPIINPDQRTSIKTILERHCHRPVRWLADNTIEIVVDGSFIKKKT